MATAQEIKEMAINAVQEPGSEEGVYSLDPPVWLVGSSSGRRYIATHVRIGAAAFDAVCIKGFERWQNPNEFEVV